MFDPETGTQLNSYRRQKVLVMKKKQKCHIHIQTEQHSHSKNIQANVHN